MDLALTEEHKLLQKKVREFAETGLKPLANYIGAEHFPRETFQKAAELGLAGVALAVCDGGASLDHIACTVMIEEISRCCAVMGTILAVQNSSFCGPIYQFGTDEQRKKFLLPFAQGKMIGCSALTELQAGSGLAALQMKAVKKDDKYVIDGTKAWITNGGVADAAVVYACTDPSRGEQGLTAFIVEKGTPGFIVGREEGSFAGHATACCELVFTDCEVPVANRLGKEGEGDKVARSALDGGRIAIGAQATGIAQGAVEASLDYLQERMAFSPPASQFQSTQFMLADMATEVDAARLLVRKAASKKDKGEPCDVDAAIAKLFASETATRVTRQALQAYGGYGYRRDYPLERAGLDAWATEVHEGSSEMQRLAIASWMLRAY